MKQTDPQFKLRLPPALKADLEAAAEKNERTLTAEIVGRLQDTFTEGPGQGLNFLLAKLQYQLASAEIEGGITATRLLSLTTGIEELLGQLEASPLKLDKNLKTTIGYLKNGVAEIHRSGNKPDMNRLVDELHATQSAYEAARDAFAHRLASESPRAQLP